MKGNFPLFLPERPYSLVSKERQDREKMTRLKKGLNIGDRATGLGLNIQVMDILLSALKNLEIIK